MYCIQIASGITCTFVFIELYSFVLGARNVLVCCSKKCHAHCRFCRYNTEYIYIKVSFIFYIFWSSKISQSIHFRLCIIPWLDQHLILFGGIQRVLNIDNCICRTLIILVSLFILTSTLALSSFLHLTCHSYLIGLHILMSTRFLPLWLLS